MGKTLSNSCDLCNIDFNKMEHMVAHLKSRHRQYIIKGYRFDQCKYATHFRSLLGKHKNAVHGGKFKCEYCGKLSKASGNHNAHVKTHSNAPLRCPVENCPAVYKTEESFHLHSLSHTNQKQRFDCDFDGCKYYSTCSNNLKNHKLTHTDNRPYNCPYEACFKAYKRNGDLTKHLKKSHEGEK